MLDQLGVRLLARHGDLGAALLVLGRVEAEVLLLDRPSEAKVALDVAVGARTTGSLEADTVVHGGDGE